MYAATRAHFLQFRNMQRLICCIALFSFRLCALSLLLCIYNRKLFHNQFCWRYMHCQHSTIVANMIRLELHIEQLTQWYLLAGTFSEFSALLVSPVSGLEQPSLDFFLCSTPRVLTEARSVSVNPQF